MLVYGLRKKFLPSKHLRYRVSARPKHLVWKLESGDPALASLRYRAIIPGLALKKLGVSSTFYTHHMFIDFRRPMDAVIFVKSFSAHDYALAREANRKGIPVYLDLCDNVFEAPRKTAEYFREMAQLSRHVVVSTQALADLILEKFGIKARIVSDTLETQESMRFTVETLERARRDYLLGHGISWFLKRGIPATARSLARKFSPRRTAHPTTSRPNGVDRSILWFGRAGEAGEWGMTDLLEIKSDLESLGRDRTLELVVVSDNQDMFDTHIAPLKIQSRFVRWTPETAHRELEAADVVIVPNRLTEFSINKSPNRTIQALASGVNVVATRTPALADLEGAVLFGDFEKNISAYLTDQSLRHQHLQKAQSIVDEKFSQRSAGEAWLSVLSGRVEGE